MLEYPSERGSWLWGCFLPIILHAVLFVGNAPATKEPPFVLTNDHDLLIGLLH